MNRKSCCCVENTIELEPKKVFEIIHFPHPHNKLVISPYGEYEIRIFDISNSKCEKIIKTIKTASKTHHLMRWNEDFERVKKSEDDILLVANVNGTISSFSISSMENLKNITNENEKFNFPYVYLRRVSFYVFVACSGVLEGFGGNKCKIDVVDYSDCKILRTIEIEGAVHYNSRLVRSLNHQQCVFFNSGGHAGFTLSMGILCINYEKCTVLQEYKKIEDEKKKFSSMCVFLNENEEEILIGVLFKRLHLFNTDSNDSSCFRTIDYGFFGVASLLISKRYLFLGPGKTLKVLDIKNDFKTVLEEDVHERLIFRIEMFRMRSFSEREVCVLTTSVDGTVKICRISNILRFNENSVENDQLERVEYLRNIFFDLGILIKLESFHWKQSIHVLKLLLVV